MLRLPQKSQERFQIAKIQLCFFVVSTRRFSLQNIRLVELWLENMEYKMKHSWSSGN